MFLKNTLKILEADAENLSPWVDLESQHWTISAKKNPDWKSAKNDAESYEFTVLQDVQFAAP